MSHQEKINFVLNEIENIRQISLKDKSVRIDIKVPNKEITIND